MISYEKACSIVSSEGFCWDVRKIVQIDGIDEITIICKYRDKMNAIIYSDFMKKVIAVTRLHY